MDRLAEVLALARRLFDGGPVTFEGRPSSPATCRRRRPRQRSWKIGFGGDSDRVLAMAGRTPTCWICTSSAARAGGRRDHGRGRRRRLRRRALTTVTDLAARIELVRAAPEGPVGGRSAVTVSTQIWFTAYGSAEQVRTGRAGRPVGGPAGTAVGPQPVPAVRRPARMAEAVTVAGRTYGLDADLTQEGDGNPYARPGPELPRMLPLLVISTQGGLPGPVCVSPTC